MGRDDLAFVFSMKVRVKESGIGCVCGVVYS